MRALDALERHLADREFLVAERYTIADIALHAYTHVAHEGGFDLAAYPSTRAWLTRVAEQPGHVADHGLSRSAVKWRDAHGQRQTATHQQPETPPRHRGGLRAHHARSARA